VGTSALSLVGPVTLRDSPLTGFCLKAILLSMAKIKTALSLQESVVERMDRLARELNTSRSQLFSRAADEFLRRYEGQALLDAINRACDGPPDPEEGARRGAMRNKQRRFMDGEW
jgi:antitoxin MazE6